MKLLPVVALLTVAALALVPFATADIDPTYYVDCSVASPALTLTLPSSAVCAVGTTVVATGPTGVGYTTGASSNVVVYVSGVVNSVTGTYKLVDMTQGGATVASGSIASASTSQSGCSLINTLTGSGTATGITVHNVDTLQLTLTFSSAVTVCTGGSTPTAVSLGGTNFTGPPPIPQFPLGMGLLVVLAIPLMLLVRSKSLKVSA